MITSCSNPKLKRVRELMERPRLRKKAGAFVIEGIRMFRETPENMLMETYVSESFHKNDPGIKGEVVSDEAFKKLSDTKTPQGIMAVVKQPEYELRDCIKAGEGLYLILEGIQDPGNLGTMIRTGEAAGVSCIIMDKNTADIFSPKVVRATMGAVYRVPFIYTDELYDTLVELKEKGVTLYAADLKGEELYHECKYSDASAFLIGNEGNGLSDRALEQADVRLKIPMKGETESLNAAVAASLLMYRYATK